MEHLALDLGGRESQVCLRAADQSILREARVPTKQLEEELKRPACRVVVETCAEAFGVADEAVAHAAHALHLPSLPCRDVHGR